ncbi:MAG: M14 family metallopeptidase [Balneolaceae bacterium]
MKKAVYLFLLMFLINIPSNAQVQSPAEFLGYDLGDQWTPHYKVLNYFKHVSDNSDLVTFQQYGSTYEGRELVYVVVTSEENHSNLDEIRSNNLKLVGFEEGDPTDNKKAIVWLSYNVHGNETSSSEAALYTIYELVTNKTAWLNDVVVIMDPMINPDGRDRYVNWNRTQIGKNANANPDAREHNEPWPGGRTNHYMFDLNRDWAWQTQKESQERIQAYLTWMPHIHVDFHEQSYNSPYYFAPAARPYHKAITQWQSDFQKTIGTNHAKYFDENSWLYFTREVFDLFYPSYGDSWPIFNGSIGMTYEQAGGGTASLAIETAEGDTLTLHDRLLHHATTGLSTVEITAQNKDRVVDEFTTYFNNAQENGSGEYKTFIVKKSSNPDKVAQLMRYLLEQKIEVEAAAGNSNSTGYNFSNGEVERVSISEGDFVIKTTQPLGNLVRVLFEPKPELEDSLTYDLTAWETHYAYGVEGFAIKGNVATTGVTLDTLPIKPTNIAKPYAYLSKWNSMDDMKFLAHILKHGVNARFAEDKFSMNGENYEAGTLIITRTGNQNLGDNFDEIVKDGASLYNRTLTPVATGMVSSGSDFGSSNVRFIEAPNVALIAGDGTSSNTVGHIWHFFEQRLDYPITLIDMDEMGSVNWDNYDVMILPSGFYNEALSENGLNELKNWIRGGGTLIAIEGANRFLAGKDGFHLKIKSSESEDDESDSKLRTYADARRGSASNINAGSIYELSMDTTHPLAFGYDDTYLSLKLGSTAFEYLDSGWNVGVAKSGAPRSGFVGSEAQKNLEGSLSYGVQDMGRGSVVYMIDNPFFRGFWHNGNLLIGNAVFIVGN